jgi:cytochrome c peroxidase
MKNFGRDALCIITALTFCGITSCAFSSRKGDTLAAGQSGNRRLEKLPKAKLADAEKVELGKILFFDPRLSGDGSMACSTCHDPEKAFTDGIALSKAYPGSKFFRNTKTLLNTQFARYYYWDARLTAKDTDTMVRDHITESHFLNLDGRIMLERLKQVPEYDKRFRAVFGGEPSFGRTLKAVGAFVNSLVSKNVPFDSDTMSESAVRGSEIFRGKGRCISCHSGPMFSDYEAHYTGVPEHKDILEDPERHFTMRSFFKFLGVPNFENTQSDVGFFAVTKDKGHLGWFVTPSLRELKSTAPYMHNGTIPTLEAVVDWYDQGTGNKALPALGLTADEKADLIEFLNALSGDPVTVKAPAQYDYAVIENWRSKDN